MSVVAHFQTSMHNVFMKFILVAIFIFPSFAHADEWTSADTYREVAYQSLAAVDWLQTRSIAKDPAQWCEQNTYLGKHPSVQSVNRYFALTGLAHVAISKMLPEKYRAPFQYVSIGVEVGAVAHNFSIGIECKVLTS